MRVALAVAVLLVSIPARAEERDSSLPAVQGSGAPPRSDSWFGVAIGAGSGGMRAGSASSSFADTLAGYDPWPLAISLRGGPTLGDRWLAGVDFSVLRLMGSRTLVDFQQGGVTYPGRRDVDAHLQTTALSVIGVFFPLRAGPFVRAGAGIASLRYEFALPSGPENESWLGLNGTAGAGWAFWLGTRLNLSVSVDGALQLFPGNDAGEPERAHTFVGAVGLDWF
jgi:hypothetical protein